MDCSDIIPAVVLHWNYRGFTEFPLHLLKGEESEITDIYLKENLISRLPTDIGRLERLESLYLSGNDISLLPREISKLRALKCLDLSGNRLRNIPDEIGDVRSLKFLILDENELSELPLRIAELRSLRYLSVCDNNLEWLPQRPVFNYHHCELRFWRNKLSAIPFSLWYHMFRDQQTRSLDIGKLQTMSRHRPICRLTITNANGSQNIDIQCPAQHQNILENVHSPPNLYELCRRRLYQIISDTAKKLTTETQSIYADLPYDRQNMTHIQEDFQNSNIDKAKSIPSEDRNGNYEFKVMPSVFKSGNKRKEKSYYAPSDIVDEHYSFLPNFMKRDLRGGPVSRCENVACLKPIFDFVVYEFCLGDIILVDRTESAILSAVFCSKTCAGAWKRALEVVLYLTSYLSWNIVFQFALEYLLHGGELPPGAAARLLVAHHRTAVGRARSGAAIYSLYRAVGMLRKNSKFNLLEYDGCFEIFTISSFIVAQQRHSRALLGVGLRELLHMEDGDHVGETTLVTKHVCRYVTAVAVTNCELFCLSRENFAIVEKYRTAFDELRKMEASRVQWIKMMDDQYKAQLKDWREMK